MLYVSFDMETDISSVSFALAELVVFTTEGVFKLVVTPALLGAGPLEG